MNQEEWNRLAEKIENSNYMNKKYRFIVYITMVILLFIFFILPLLPLFLTEEFMAHCIVCNNLIEHMSKYIPGIKVASEVSKFPYIATMILSLSWLSIIFFVIFGVIMILIQNYGNWEFFFYSKTKLILLYLGVLLIVCIETGIIGGHSFYNGTIALYHPNSRRNLFFWLMQYKLGIGVFAFLQIFWVSIFYSTFVLLNIQFVEKLFKGDKNE